MRRAGHFLLLVGLGAVLGWLTWFVNSPVDPPIGIDNPFSSIPTAPPRSAPPTPSRETPPSSAGVPSSGAVADNRSAGSERERVFQSAVIPMSVAVADPLYARVDELPVWTRQWFVKRDDIASYPPHWCFRLSGATFEVGDNARLHVALDSSVVAQGSRSARVDTTALPPGVTAVLWQAVHGVVTSYRGSRLELVVQVRSEAPVALVFLRSQSEGPRISLGDLRSDLAGEPGVKRSIVSGADWTRVAVVQDVPFDASFVYYGVALYGNGKLWLDDVRLTVVDTRVPLTHDDSDDDGRSIPIGPPQWSYDAPSNLDFELTSAASGAYNHCERNRRDPALDPP